MVNERAREIEHLTSQISFADRGHFISLFEPVFDFAEKL